MLPAAWPTWARIAFVAGLLGLGVAERVLREPPDVGKPAASK